MKTIEELKKEQAELASALEAKKLSAEIAKTKAEIEVVEQDEKKLALTMKEKAVKGDFENFTKANAERIAKEQAAKNEQTDEKVSAATPHFGKEVVKEMSKSFGSSRADDLLVLAKDIAKALPVMDGIAMVKKCHISETEMFRKNFGNFARHEVDAAVKALTTSGSGTGAEYVLTGWTDQVAMRLMNSNVALANLPVIDLPHNPYRLPIYTAVPTTYYCSEGSTISASDPTTSNKDFSAAKIANYVKYSGELAEDAIVAIQPFAERIMIESLGNAIERCILFGDTVTTANTNINLIDGTPTTTAGAASQYLAVNGLVKECFGSNGKTTDINADIIAGFAAVIQKMGVGAVNMQDLVSFVGVELLFKYMASSSFLTWDKAGAKAGLLNGAPGALFGVPVFASSGLPKVNSSGYIPAAGGTLGALVVAKKSGVLVGFKRRPLLSDVQGLQPSDQSGWVASARFDVKVIMPNATDKAAVSYGYNAGL